MALPQKSDQLFSFTPGLQPGEQQQAEPGNRFNGLHSEVTDNMEVLCPAEMETVETVI